MKTFKDLEFKPHPCAAGLQARMDFPNGYGVSVVRFRLPGGFDGIIAEGAKVAKGEKKHAYGSYTDNENEWELAVFHNGSICYSSPVTDDVEGHLLADDVTRLMKELQEIPAAKACKHGRKVA